MIGKRPLRDRLGIKLIHSSLKDDNAAFIKITATGANKLEIFITMKFQSTLLRWQGNKRTILCFWGEKVVRLIVKEGILLPCRKGGREVKNVVCCLE